MSAMYKRMIDKSLLERLATRVSILGQRGVYHEVPQTPNGCSFIAREVAGVNGEMRLESNYFQFSVHRNMGDSEKRRLPDRERADSGAWLGLGI